MKERSFLTTILATMLLLSLGGLTGAVAASLPAVGGVLPDLSPGFNLPKPKDGVVIIQIFSMYCPYCQKDAPQVNRLYEMIEADPSLKGRVRLVGIGAGNSPYEVNVFRTKFNVRFPLYADPDFNIHKKLGEPRTPYFIALKIEPDGSHRIFYSQLGEIGSADDFLAEMIRRWGKRR
ncbi:MAG: TlpA disulfide reductase family protein [Pseudomonadota bacterium]|nr:TlpA disulfide reductase family protein [Pseudomonadota bacterium]